MSNGLLVGNADGGTGMHWEVEQKFSLATAEERDQVHQALKQLGVKFQQPIRQVDRYFNHPARDFGQTDEALRLRQVGEQNVVTYKGPKIDAATKTRRELELPLAAGTEVFRRYVELLLVLGFIPAGIVEKSREIGQVTWRDWHIEVALDDVRGLGPFVELELSATDDTLAGAKTALTELAEVLGLRRNERRSYLELFRSQV
jgi:adenylate cyclase class 2